MKKISIERLINESVNGVNHLLKEKKSGKYNGGLIGPSASSLFMVTLLIHDEYKKMPPTCGDLLKNFYKYSSKNNNNDFELIGCMRHALAHNDFSFQIDFLVFNGNNKLGNLKLPYREFPSLINEMVHVLKNVKKSYN